MTAVGTRWTPGPWTWRRISELGDLAVCSADENDGFRWESDGQIEDGRDKADARLMSTSPELYEALYALVHTPASLLHPRHREDWLAALERGRAVLAKARGEA